MKEQGSRTSNWCSTAAFSRRAACRAPLSTSSMRSWQSSALTRSAECVRQSRALPVTNTPEEFAAHVQSEMVKLGKLVQLSRARVE